MARITGIAIVTYVFVVCTSCASSDFSRITSESSRLGRTLAGFENVGRSGGYVETELVRELNKDKDGGFVPSPGYISRQSKVSPSSSIYSSHISQVVPSSSYGSHISQVLPSSSYRSHQQVASKSSGFTSHQLERVTSSGFASKPSVASSSSSFQPQIASSHLNSTVLPSSSSHFNNSSEVQSNSARSSARSRGFVPSPTSYPDELSVVASPRGNSKSIEEQKIIYMLSGQHTTTRASQSHPSDDFQSSENDEEEEDEEEETSDEESGDEESEETALTTVISTRPIPAVDVQSKAKRKTRGKKVKKIKGFKKLKKYLLPLVIAYKLKFLMMIPLLLGGLVLLVGTTGFAGFFFALFAVGISLRKE